MSSRICLIRDNNSLQPLVNQKYENEDLLQRLLADFPEVLDGEEIDGRDPRRWLLVRREMPLGDSAESTGRWSLDHLLLDQEGIPTLIEVKRSTDRRLRREVVGQMLDYAANAVVYLPLTGIQAALRETCTAAGKVTDDVLVEFLGVDGDLSERVATIDAYWAKVQKNLTDRNVRLVFVADEIPTELRRIIEFLNEEMAQVEVLGVEIKQFVGAELRTLVPRVIGRTEKSRIVKPPLGVGRRWDRDSFISALRERSGQELVMVAERLLEWAETKAQGVRWGSGKSPTLTVRVVVEGKDRMLLMLNTLGRTMVGLAIFPQPTAAEELRSRLAKINGFDLSEAVGWPEGDGRILVDPQAMVQFMDAMEYALSQLQSDTGKVNAR